MPKKKAKELPLEVMPSLTFSNEHGPQIFFHLTRGMMHDWDVRNVNNPPLSGPYGERARVTLEHLQKKTRAHLEAAGHPTDQHPIMPVELDTSYFPQESGIIRDEDIWYDVVKGSTEPLTEDRIAAELLHAVTGVLTSFTDEQMNIIFRAMKFYGLFQMIDGLHD